MALGMISPNVLDLEATLASTSGVVHVMGWHPGPGLNEVNHPGKKPVDLTPVRTMKPEPIVTQERLSLRVKPLPEDTRQIIRIFSPDVSHNHEHRVLHRRVVHRTPVPDPPMDEDVEEGRYDSYLA